MGTYSWLVILKSRTWTCTSFGSFRIISFCPFMVDHFFASFSSQKLCSIQVPLLMLNFCRLIALKNGNDFLRFRMLQQDLNLQICPLALGMECQWIISFLIAIFFNWFLHCDFTVAMLFILLNLMQLGLLIWCLKTWRICLFEESYGALEVGVFGTVVDSVKGDDAKPLGTRLGV